ncbi:MAG: T9SS type A sorting domain-containing protein [Bacteroidetes bacterium]|nr:T9SS type A sorting domain-containing protein [Bacteroidota bacterium]
MKRIFTLITVLFFIITNSQSQNKAGTLDSSFGIDGKVLTSFDGHYLGCTTSAVTNEGNIIVAGTTSSTDSIPNSMGFMAARYSANGVLDTLFGNKGLAIAEGPYEGYAVAVQHDDKIIIGGVGYAYNSKYFVLARLNTDGSVDSSFGDNGRVINLLGTIIFDIAIQKDNKIVISGTNGYAFVTMRYLPDGVIDDSFGDSGVVITDFNSIAYPSVNIIQPDGKIVVAGDNGVKILLARYNIDGSIDQSFGTNGKVIFKPKSSINNAGDIVQQPDGKILLAGSASNFISGDVQLMRFLPNGQLDSTFGSYGITIKKLQYSSAASKLALQTDGKSIISGYAYVNSTYGHFLIERFNSNGNIDSSFGTNGYQITEMNQYDASIGVFLQKDNKIVLAGGASNIDSIPPITQIALTRYNNDLTKKQIIIAKIRRWIQHHNGIMWDNISGVKKYSVQRSGDGAHWSTVYNTINHSLLSIHHSQLSINNYYNDPSPLPGTNYYRLQTTSRDGEVQYSNILAITNNDAIKISPNPANNILHIEGLSSKAKITVISFNGFTAISQQLIANGSYNLDIASLQPGNYLLKIEMNGEVVTKKFLKE